MRNWIGRLCVFALFASAASSAQAASHGHQHKRFARIQDFSIQERSGRLADGAAATPIHAAPVGDITRVPYGWADFCTRRIDECRVDVADPVDIVSTRRVMRTLETINRQVNAEIEPVSNLDHWGTLLDHWDYPTDGKGDCKIYALWKRKQLLDLGFPRQALLMTIVRDLEGNGHTILTVKTDKGDYILDNMVGEIRLWDETGYKFVKRQSQEDPNVWVSIGPTTMPVTTARVN